MSEPQPVLMQTAAAEPGRGEYDDLLPKPVADKQDDSDVARRPELVVAIVSAIGTGVESVVEALTAAFKSVNYVTEIVRVSELLALAHDQSTAKNIPRLESGASWLMDLGDELRDDLGMGVAACSLAVASIRQARRKAMTGPDDERAGVVTIIRSVKRADEIEMLQSVYGSRLLVLGISATEQHRLEALITRLQHENQGKDAGWYASSAIELITRDQKDNEKPLGQQVERAFSRADAFVWLRPGRTPADAVNRLVRIWFGEPFTTPSRDEQAMFYARAAKFRSAAAGRQVGVAIVDSYGEVLVTGANDVPKPGGGQYWPDEGPDYRDFTLEYEMNDRLKLDVALDVIARLHAAKWFNQDVLDKDVHTLTNEALQKKGPLGESRITDLLEFGRIMHAEMAAICTAARRGTPLLGTTLYTTTYPCHECARLIIGSGINKVVFVDPYPKSQVTRLYKDQVTDLVEGESGSMVAFVPFEGVAPVLFAKAFNMNKRERQVDGTFFPWVPTPLAERIPDGAPPLSNETGVLKTFGEKYRVSEWVPKAP